MAILSVESLKGECECGDRADWRVVRSADELDQTNLAPCTSFSTYYCSDCKPCDVGGVVDAAFLAATVPL
jgi:hypothetical protein